MKTKENNTFNETKQEEKKEKQINKKTPSMKTKTIYKKAGKITTHSKKVNTKNPSLKTKTANKQPNKNTQKINKHTRKKGEKMPPWTDTLKQMSQNTLFLEPQQQRATLSTVAKCTNVATH